MNEAEIQRQARALAWAQCYATILAGLLTSAASTRTPWESIRQRAKIEANLAYEAVGISV